MKKIATDDVPCWMKAAAIGYCEHRGIGISMRIGGVGISWVDPNVVTGKTFDQFAAVSNRPFFDVCSQPIGILQNEIRSASFLGTLGEFGGTNQAGNHRGKCRR